MPAPRLCGAAVRRRVQDTSTRGARLCCTTPSLRTLHHCCQLHATASRSQIRELITPRFYASKRAAGCALQKNVRALRGRAGPAAQVRRRVRDRRLLGRLLPGGDAVFHWYVDGARGAALVDAALADVNSSDGERLVVRLVRHVRGAARACGSTAAAAQTPRAQRRRERGVRDPERTRAAVDRPQSQPTLRSWTRRPCRAWPTRASTLFLIRAASWTRCTRATTTRVGGASEEALRDVEARAQARRMRRLLVSMLQGHIRSLVERACDGACSVDAAPASTERATLVPFCLRLRCEHETLAAGDDALTAGQRVADWAALWRAVDERIKARQPSTTVRVVELNVASAAGQRPRRGRGGRDEAPRRRGRPLGDGTKTKTARVRRPRRRGGPCRGRRRRRGRRPGSAPCVCSAARPSTTTPRPRRPSPTEARRRAPSSASSGVVRAVGAGASSQTPPPPGRGRLLLRRRARATAPAPPPPPRVLLLLLVPVRVGPRRVLTRRRPPPRAEGLLRRAEDGCISTTPYSSMCTVSS